MSHLEKNLAALAPHNPALAQAMHATPIPEGYLPTPGTDGTPTFCRISTEGGKKRREWLGATSMPAASANAIISTLDPLSNGASGLALSIATGYEWAAFIQRLPRAQLLYLYEPDLGHLRMALEICDLSPHLHARRLILLTGTPNDAGHALADFLSQNPGFDPPSVLHPLPTLIGERRASLLAAGEHIVRHAINQRQAMVAELHDRLAAAVAAPPSQPSQTLALLLTPRYAAERPIQHAAASAAARLTLDAHDSASLAIRYQRLLDLAQRGSVCILSDLFRSQLEPLPTQVSVETWIPPLIGPAFWDRIPASSTFAPQDRIVVHFAHHAQSLISRDIPRERIDLRPLTSVLPPAGTHSSPNAGAQRIALIADLPPSDMQSLGIQLPTHQSIYAAARDLIQADPLSIRPAIALDLLRRAMNRAGIDPKLDDPSLKDAMLRILLGVLIPALPPLAIAAALSREGLSLALIGDWPNLSITPPSDVQRVPFASVSTQTWKDVAILLHFSPLGAVSPLLVDAISAGIPIVSPRHATDIDAGTLPTLLKPDVDFAHPMPQSLIPALKSLLKDPARRQALAASASRMLNP